MSAFFGTLAFAVAMLSGQTAPPTDPCLALLPLGLTKVVEGRFPRHRLPTLRDNASFDIEYEKKHGGDGCLGADRGDYNGDASPDFALLLATREPNGDEPQAILVAALSEGSGWKMSVLRDWGAIGRDRLFVMTVPPGRYQRTEALDDPPTQPGEVDLIESTFDAVATGVTESSEIVYSMEAGCWRHVWVSD